MNHYIGAPAATVAESITQIFVKQERLLRDQEAWDRINRAHRGDYNNITNPIPRLPDASFHMMVITSQIDLMWRRSRVIYAIDPDMEKELTSSTSTTMPGTVFRQIPHTNPLVVFPEPIDVDLPTGQRGQVYGFYVYGATGRPAERSRRLTYTDDDNARSLGLMFVTGVLDDNDVRVDWDLTRMSVPVDVEKFDVPEAVNTVLDNYAMDFMVSGTPRAQLDKWLGKLMPLALNTLLYLCTEDPDLQTVPVRKPKHASKKKGNDAPRREKPTRLIKVGWRLGPALRAARRAAEQRPTTTGTGRSQPPHQRRGHFKMQFHGQGRALRKLIYVMPYMVRLDLLDSQPLENRVIPVR